MLTYRNRSGLDPASSRTSGFLRSFRFGAEPGRRRLRFMVLERAVEADYPAVVGLANVAYRGGGEAEGWCTEADLIEGTRLTEDLLRGDLEFAVLEKEM